MSEKFTIISNDKEQVKANHAIRIIRLNELWKRQYNNSILQAMEKNKDVKIQDYPQHNLMKIALSGIKYISTLRNVQRENNTLGTGYTRSIKESQAMFQLIDAIFIICGYLTLRNFITIFPIEKRYDGEKWECKDYYFTMNALSDIDWDKPIGRDNISELLWDYENIELRHVYVDFMSAMSDIYKSQTGKGIAETWVEDLGIESYSSNDELGIIQNNRTGEISKLNKNISHLKIVK